MEEVARFGVQVTGTQLERWRSAGIVPRNRRKALGRTRGSTSEFEPETVDLVSSIAAAAMPGRSIYESVLRIFTCDPVVFDLLDDCSSTLIPERALRDAFAWFVQSGDRSLDRRIERMLSELASDTDRAIEAIMDLSIRQYRDSRRAEDDMDWNPFVGTFGETSGEFGALHILKHLASRRLASTASRN
jgi:hypothetical protein